MSVQGPNHEPQVVQPAVVTGDGTDVTNKALKARQNEIISQPAQLELQQKKTKVVEGGSSQTSIAERITNSFTRRSIGFFSYIFGSITEAMGSLHERASNLSIQKNIKDSFKLWKGKDLK